MFLKGLIVGLTAIIMVALMAVLGGTIVYWIWPIAIPAVFPTLLGGAIAGKLLWWQAVCLTWLCGLLIKSSQTNNNKD